MDDGMSGFKPTVFNGTLLVAPRVKEAWPRRIGSIESRYVWHTQGRKWQSRSLDEVLELRLRPVVTPDHE
jgi:hypothetical protein